MRLVHGTIASCAMDAPKIGLTPRWQRKSNWDIASHPDHVYLTCTYALHYAYAARDGRQGIHLGLVEIETDDLDVDKLMPDEDAIAQVWQLNNNNDLTLNEKTEYVRDNMERFNKKFNYEWSLNKLGNCAYAGIIPPKAITRVVLINSSTSFMDVFDPSITIANFKYLGNYYKELQKMFIGREYDKKEIEFRFPPQSLENRLKSVMTIVYDRG